MGIAASFDAIAGLPPERRLKLVEAALLDGYSPLHSAAFALLADPAGLNRPDVLVARYAALPPELRQRMSHQKDRFLPAARALLDSEREGDRRAGLSALFALDPYDSVPSLCRMLDDPSSAVVEIAAARLGELGERYYFHLVASRLHADPESRDYLDGYAPRMFVLLPHVFRAYPKHEKKVFFDIAIESGPDAYPVILEHLLVRGAAPLRRAFLDSLQASATEPAVRLLFRLHSERVGRLKETAADVLRRRADAGFASLVAATLTTMDHEEALSVAKSQAELPWWPEPDAIADIDSGTAFRLLDFAATSSLPARVRDELILRFRRSPRPEVRVRVLSLLQVLEHPGFAAIAEEALNDPDDEVKAAGARAVVGLNPPHKAKLLLPLLNSTSDELRRFVMREVASSGVERYLAASERLDARTRETAVRALAKIDPRVVDRFLEEVVSRDPAKRMAALRAVDLLGEEPAARERLLPLLTDPDKRVRATATRVVKGGVERLLEALRDPDGRVRANAVDALGETGDPRAPEAIAALLGDVEPRARANAALALARLGREEGRRALEAMARDPDGRARLSAVWALGRLEGSEAFLRELGESESDPVVRGRLAESIQIAEARRP